MNCNRAKCKVLFSGGDPVQHIGSAENRLKAILRRRAWGCWLTTSSNMRRQCALTARKGDCVLGCIQSSVASRVGNSGPLPWDTQYKKDVELMDSVLRRGRGDQRAGAPFLWRGCLAWRKKFLWRSYCSLLVSKWGLQRRLKRHFSPVVIGWEGMASNWKSTVLY